MTCLDAADTNDDEVVNMTDAIYLLDYLLLGRDEPPAPFRARGVDSTGDGTLTCP